MSFYLHAYQVLKSVVYLQQVMLEQADLPFFVRGLVLMFFLAQTRLIGVCLYIP